MSWGKPIKFSAKAYELLQKAARKLGYKSPSEFVERELGKYERDTEE